MVSHLFCLFMTKSNLEITCLCVRCDGPNFPRNHKDPVPTRTYTGLPVPVSFSRAAFRLTSFMVYLLEMFIRYKELQRFFFSGKTGLPNWLSRVKVNVQSHCQHLLPSNTGEELPLLLTWTLVSWRPEKSKRRHGALCLKSQHERSLLVLGQPGLQKKIVSQNKKERETEKDGGREGGRERGRKMKEGIKRKEERKKGREKEEGGKEGQEGEQSV